MRTLTILIMAFYFLNGQAGIFEQERRCRNIVESCHSKDNCELRLKNLIRVRPKIINPTISVDKEKGCSVAAQVDGVLKTYRTFGALRGTHAGEVAKKMGLGHYARCKDLLTHLRSREDISSIRVVSGFQLHFRECWTHRTVLQSLLSPDPWENGHPEDGNTSFFRSSKGGN